MSKTFWVDFSGYCEIEAETAEEAEQKFWDFINEDMPLPQNIYDVDGVEEKTEQPRSFCFWLLLAGHVRRGQNFHYTTAPAFLSRVLTKKKEKKFLK